jgi:hypothetical protein
MSEKALQFASESLKNTNRLVVQRVLSAPAAKYLEKKNYDSLSRAFLSEAPDFPLEIRFSVPNSRSSYYDSICALTVSWTVAENENNDEDGNVWRYHKLVTKTTISSCYEGEQFETRLECMNLVKDLIDQVRDLAPEPIRLMTLNSEQRLARDTARKKEAAFALFVSAMKSTGKKLRANMRIGGRARGLPQGLAMAFDPGTYLIDVNDGSARRPRTKTYMVMIPENRSRNSYFKRTA